MLDKIRTLSRQTLIYGTSTIVGRFINFLLVPFYTNVFPPSVYGEFTVVFAYIALFNVVFSLGFESGYFKFASTLEQGSEKENFSMPLFVIFLNSAVLSSLILVFSGPLASTIGLSAGYSTIVKYSAFILFFDALLLVPFANLRLKNKAGVFALVKFANILINVTLNFVLVLGFKWGVEGIFISNLAASSITFLMLIPVVVRNLSFSFHKKLLSELWRFSVPYVPAGLASIMVQVISRPIMLYLTDEATVGIFQANFKLGIFMMLVVSMFEYAWRPFFLNNAREADAKRIFSSVMTYFTGFASIILIFLTFFIDDIIRFPLPGRGTLIGPKFWGGVIIVPIILFAYLLNGMYINLMAGVYIEKKTKYLPQVTGLGAVVNIAANFLLIPMFGLYGGAFAVFLSYLTMTLYLYKLTKSFYPVNYELGKIVLINIVNTAAVAAFYLSHYSVLPGGLLVKTGLFILLSALSLRVSGLWKVKKLLVRKPEKPAPDDKLVTMDVRNGVDT